MDLSLLQSRQAAERAASILRGMAPDRELKFLHVCGTHENTVTRYGIRSLLPPTIKIVAGPGCPVCVTGTSDIDLAIEVAENHSTVYTYGDMFSVPGGDGSLRDARSRGANVKVVYSISDAVKMAEESGEPSTFFSIGFETTTPLTASVILSGVPENMTFVTSHRLIPPALEALLNSGKIEIDGLICPGHVSTIIGTEPYEIFVEEYGIPVVVAGFEPLDIMLGLMDLLKQWKTKRPRVFNEYSRCVRREGNRRAREMMDEVFQVCDSEWRGIGNLPSTGLCLREEYQDLEASRVFGLKRRAEGAMPPGCRCSEVLLGACAPSDCPLFGKRCTPDHPVGPCMVSGEGTCKIWFLYGGYEQV